MPRAIFTLHTYGSWLPDKPQGYVMRGQGIQPPDPQRAAVYRQRMTQDAVFSWEDDTPVERARRALKFSISHKLNLAFIKHRWLGRKGSNQLVKDRHHLKHLCDVYLPSHRGWGWDERHGWVPPR